MVGNPEFWVRWSGVAELACAGLLIVPRTRRVGGLLTIVVLLAVFPANVKMALDGRVPGQPFPLGSPMVAWARLPVQVPMVIWAWRVAVADGRGGHWPPTSTVSSRRHSLAGQSGAR